MTISTRNVAQNDENTGVLVGEKVSPAMVIRKPTELAPLLARDARILGLDQGEKIIGLALSDMGRTIATPFGEIHRSKKFAPVAAELRGIIAENDVGALIIGLPINMDGSEGRRCQSVRQFAANLAATIDIPMAFWDERLSTMAVTRAQLEADLSRKRRKETVDRLAAAYILQGALDRMKAE